MAKQFAVTKAFSTVEVADVNSSLGTEFHWEVHSLEAMLKASRHKVFSRDFLGGRGGRDRRCIMSPCFTIKGTEDSSHRLGREKSGHLWVVGDANGGDHYEVSLTCDAPIQGELTVTSGGKELKSPAMVPAREDHVDICKIMPDTELHSAIVSSSQLCIVVRLNPLPRVKVVDTVVNGDLQEIPAPSLSEVLGNALSSNELQELTDVELVAIDGETFRGHRQLLALRSDVFRATFYGGMRESQTMRTHVQASGAAVKGLLHFIYTDKVDFTKSAACAVELLDLGMQYELPRLNNFIKQHLLETLSIENAAERVQLGIRYDATQLRDAAVSLVQGNLCAIMETDGWASISKNPLVMKALVNSDRKTRKSSVESLFGVRPVESVDSVHLSCLGASSVSSSSGARQRLLRAAPVAHAPAALPRLGASPDLLPPPPLPNLLQSSSKRMRLN